MRERLRIRIGQLYRQKRNKMTLEVFGKASKDKWKTRVLTAKPGVYNGSHTMNEFSLRRYYDLIEKTAI